MDHKRKFWLLTQAKNFCSVPWNHFKVDTGGTVTTCGNGKTPLGSVLTTQIGDIIHSESLHHIKKNLVADHSDQNCVKCLGPENHDYKILRNLYNPMFKKSKVNYDNQDDFILSGVDLHWSSVCDLKCITCWEKQSSSIATERGAPVLHTPTEHADQIIDFIVDNQSSLREIYLSGGEPTLIKHNLRLLKRLDKDKDFVIRVNTNMMFNYDNQIVSELKKFPRVLFTISADATRERFNYIRRGANWDKFIHNLNLLKSYEFSWRVNTVFFVGSALGLPDTQEYFMQEHGICDFTINQVAMGHPEIRCRNLPQYTKDIVEKNLQIHLEKYKQNGNLEEQLLICLKEIANEPENSYVDFFEYIDTLERTSWKETFPELTGE